MANFSSSIAPIGRDIDVSATLANQLNQKRQRYSGRITKAVYVLATVHDDVDDEWEQRLRQMTTECTEACIVLIPYKVNHSHWIGIVLEFETDGQLRKAEYIDPVKFSNFTLDKVQRVFTRYFPNYVLKPKTLMAHEDPVRSITLTIANLLQIAENSLSQDASNTNPEKLNSTFRYDIQNDSTKSDNDQELFTPIINTNVQGNQYQSSSSCKNSSDMSMSHSSAALAENPDKEVLHQLEQELLEGLRLFRIQDLKELPTRIEKTEQRTKEYQDEGRDEDASKERQRLKQYNELRSLAERIDVMKDELLLDDNSDELKLAELRQRLKNGLEKRKIKDLAMLEERMTSTKHRIQSFYDENRDEDAKKEEHILHELNALEQMVFDMTELEKKIKNDTRKVRRLMKSLKDGLQKLRMPDVSKLSGMIQNTEKRIKDYHDEGRDEDTEKERQRLTQLRDLQSLNEQIVALTAVPPDIDDEMKLLHLQEKLKNELEKVQIKNVEALADRITRIEKRIESYRLDDMNADVEKEEIILVQLQGIQDVAKEVAKLESVLNSDGTKLDRLKKLLNDESKRMNILDLTTLSERMKRCEQRIKDYRLDDLFEEVKKEESKLKDLLKLQEIELQIAELDSKLKPKELEFHRLETALSDGLEKLNIADVETLMQKIKRLEERIQSLMEDGLDEDAEKERRRLTEYQKLESLTKEIAKLIPVQDKNSSQALRETELVVNMSEVNTSVEVVHRDRFTEEKGQTEEKNQAELVDLRMNIATLPVCAERTVLEFLVTIQEKYLNKTSSMHEEHSLLVDTLDRLRNQLHQEELWSEQVRDTLQNLHGAWQCNNHALTISILGNFLKKIRLLNVDEIKRLVAKTNEAAEAICDQHIILLIGATGSGKSTTIQFLAGEKMKAKRVQVETERFLDHIEIDGEPKNPEIKRIISSPLSRSETRFISSVNVTDKGIILCDAPGFGDTDGPEVDIANGVGVIEALRRCKSVTILALSSFQSLGDRGEGIQKLAHILINMMKGIEKRLDSIVYAFTKYPPQKDIHAILVEIKKNKVEKDAALLLDTAFVTVLEDMIEKTDDCAHTIDPLGDYPKNLIRRLKSLRGIVFPGEVFQFSMSPETQAVIVNHVQRKKLSVITAIKCKNIDLVKYYLDNLKTLNDLIKQTTVQDAYAHSTRIVSEGIDVYYGEVIKRFSRALTSQDGVHESDIYDCKTIAEYLQESQKLREHLGSKLPLPKALIENIDLELQKRFQALSDEELQSPSIGIFLNNFLAVNNAFPGLSPKYKEICQCFKRKFDTLLGSIREPILANEFPQVAEILLKIYASSNILKQHLPYQTENRFRESVEFLLEHLNSFAERVNPLLERFRLNDKDLHILRESMDVLKTAKDTATLQDRLCIYGETVENKNDNQEEYSINRGAETDFKTLNGIYNSFLSKILDYFVKINMRVKELLERGKEHALEDIEDLINNMDRVRTIPEFESKTSVIYYRTVENVRGFMHQLQNAAEQLLRTVENQTGIIDYGRHSKALLRLKNAEWMNRVSPGAYDHLIRHIAEELLQYAQQLETRLSKLDYSLRCPANVNVACEIVQNIESMRILEQLVPQLEPHRKHILQRFRDAIQKTFDQIQSTFNLQDKSLYQAKKELKELEQIKRDYESLHPANIHLQKNEYANIDMLNSKIEELKSKESTEIKAIEEEIDQMIVQSNTLTAIAREYMDLSSRTPDSQEILETIAKRAQIIVQGDNAPKNQFLRRQGYASIDDVYEATVNNKNELEKKQQWLDDKRRECSHHLNGLQSIGQQYQALLVPREMISLEEMSFLQEKGLQSIETLEDTIAHHRKNITQREQHKQTYDFSDRFDAAAANNALLYISQCEQVDHESVRQTVAETSPVIEKYIREYGQFLSEEIRRTFQDVVSIGPNGDPSDYSYILETRMGELSSLSRFSCVFDCIGGAERIAYWQREFIDYHHTLSSKMEQCRVSNNNRELQHQLAIAQTLNCLDRCVDRLVGNGFAALYRQYQVEVTKEAREAYRTVLNCIMRGDYAGADMALSDIKDRPLNERDLQQIKHDLKTSLNKLMRDTNSMVYWLDGKIEREEDNRNQITILKENIDKVRIALNRQGIMELLDTRTQTDLQNFDTKINEQLSSVILKGLKCMQDFMDGNNFSEAEQGIENLNRVQRELVGYYTSSQVSDKTDEIRKKLDNIVDDILKRYESANIDDYATNPPKDLLAKLKQVASHGGTRYNQAYTTITANIRKKFSQAIESARDLSPDERSARIRQLIYALCFLPDDLQNQFKLQIDQLSKSLDDRENKNRRELDSILENREDEEQIIIKMSTLAQQYSNEKQHELFEKLRQVVVNKLQVHRTAIENFLDKQDMQSVIDIAKKIFKYRTSLGSTIKEVETIHSSIRDSIMKNFELSSGALMIIAISEHPQIIENAFDNMIVCLRFSNTFDSKDQKWLSESAVERGNQGFRTLAEYLCRNSEHFQVLIEEMNVIDLHKIISISKRWDNLVKKIKQCQGIHNTIQDLVTSMVKVISYHDMVSRLESEALRLQKELNVELIDKERARFEKDRENFFINLMKTISKLRDIAVKFKLVLPETFDVGNSENQLKAKITHLHDQLLVIASKPELSLRDTDNFRIYYNHISAFDKHVRLPGFNTRRFLEESEEKIFQKASLLAKAVISSASDTAKVAEILIKMKFLAENLSMLDNTINTDIDEALKAYKLKVGTGGIMQLTMALEKDDVGSRLISEHACLSGEDWRKRREKMQNQDNLDYVLNELKGDDLSKIALRARYETFRAKYDALISTVLLKWDQKVIPEPNLDALIFQTKHLLGKVSKSTDSIIWDQTLIDSLPELLANIFAIWTLKNTQHYNSSRGIDSASAYLLMPHAAQVIAIFRTLSLGYDTTMRLIARVPVIGKISDDLVNNLVEAGTGEGKSVVMAVTACIFALIGADVNCSCYSEVLSNRDKNDFASVFRALGIEERIEYGTFNKLCESLLNEQCNVREAVRDMIMNNKNALDAGKTSKRMRPKVLLIDEVDVFLSEKYYGGMYTPALPLTDPLIKGLLDMFWANKTMRNMNIIKTMPAYIACASKFSNWMFLFDEAIKDMLAALKSFESSTYIVQNDRIAYVEGESIAENVVRGYDTIWAYFHEHEKGSITASSLAANAGIIINCGTFSYAEMPHEFAYISGVTGTLSTLAAAEKDILKRVYSVHKNTFMPSVFGKSNRTYDPTTDVIIVDESEYFMKIRGEIDAVCNAHRAVLVFFESEEKLLEFYNSPQLSSKKNDVQIVTEKVSVKDRELYIKRAATLDTVTLLTRIFGRGTDFVCRNQNLLLNGGIHVLQTFFSQELSEQYQIMGRGARQGDKGSYRMILLDKELEWVLGPAWKDELSKIPSSRVYERLNEARNARYDSKCGAKELGIEQCKRDHIASKCFMKALSAGNMNDVKKFLLEQNRGANLVTVSSRTVLLMDATASMSSLLTAAKETVCTMFERATTILKEKSLPCDAFQLQFVVYRDYDCKAKGLLQSSPWETKPNNLKAFMAEIKPMGGGDYEEAIEIGLFHAVQESAHPDGISQVILIGDAPAKDSTAITRDRRSSGGNPYWAKTKYKNQTHFTTELAKLKQKNIPVHAFYLHIGARDNFQKIASETKGRCELLNIHCSQGAELLTNFVTEEVLRKTAGDQGNAAVELYREKYAKAVFLS